MFHFLSGLPLLILMMFWVFGTVVYFLPTIITLAMRKRQRLAIILLNIFGGWTGIGWLVALIWAAIKEKSDA